ncbi:hypothetical protein RJ640_029775 [Escallonia rubra]|uniref:Uncharacterized protein n=2 Tax=Escallonia rubra TaxID=112253 RepID=A0AA88QZ82_9ASTE|nr:hypothetical protein RJ640_029775 [Escallonia rubra]
MACIVIFTISYSPSVSPELRISTVLHMAGSLQMLRQGFLSGCLQDLNSQWRPVKKGITEYFTLGDLWECYDEWSAYGAGTPVALNNGENVVQYYVPYLSAIQIYVNKSSKISRNPRYDTDPVEFEVDSWSDDSESDKLSRSLSNNSSKAWDATSADSSIDHEGALPLKDLIGNLYFEYYDTCSPNWRILLMDKIIEFAQTYPGLLTLKNVDLSPASWMVVAWCVTPYPQKCSVDIVLYPVVVDVLL